MPQVCEDDDAFLYVRAGSYALLRAHVLAGSSNPILQAASRCNFESRPRTWVGSRIGANSVCTCVTMDRRVSSMEHQLRLCMEFHDALNVIIRPRELAPTGNGGVRFICLYVANIHAFDVAIAAGGEQASACLPSSIRWGY